MKEGMRPVLAEVTSEVFRRQAIGPTGLRCHGSIERNSCHQHRLFQPRDLGHVLFCRTSNVTSCANHAIERSSSSRCSCDSCELVDFEARGAASALTCDRDGNVGLRSSIGTSIASSRGHNTSLVYSAALFAHSYVVEQLTSQAYSERE